MRPQPPTFLRRRQLGSYRARRASDLPPPAPCTSGVGNFPWAQLTVGCMDCEVSAPAGYPHEEVAAIRIFWQFHT